MSAFDQIAEMARGAAYDLMGDAATYQPPGGDAVPCWIMIDVRDQDAKPEDGRPLAGQVTITVRASEVALPVHHGRFVITASGKTYTVVSRPLPVDAAGAEWSMWAE